MINASFVHSDCLYSLSTEEIARPMKTFLDAIAIIVGDEITLTFSEPKTLTEVFVQTTDGEPVQLTVIDQHGHQSDVRTSILKFVKLQFLNLF